MLGSLKHIIARDIDEEPKATFWTEWLSKPEEQERVTLTGCPRAKELIDQMKRKVFHPFSLLS